MCVNINRFMFDVYVWCLMFFWMGKFCGYCVACAKQLTYRRFRWFLFSFFFSSFFIKSRQTNEWLTVKFKLDYLGKINNNNKSIAFILLIRLHLSVSWNYHSYHCFGFSSLLFLIFFWLFDNTNRSLGRWIVQPLFMLHKVYVCAKLWTNYRFRYTVYRR